MNFIIMNGVETYEDMQNWFCAYGWGCKCCGNLYSPEWWQASGDTYCKRCKEDMDAELGDVEFHEYPKIADTDKTVAMTFKYDENSDGFAYAAWQRQDYERTYG